MKPHISQVALSTPFDNSTNGYTAENVQDAIDEAKLKAIETVRFSICSVFNGTVSNNQWLTFSNLIPGDTVPIVVPLDCKINEISFSFNQTNVSGRFDVYKNGITSGDIIDNTTFTFTNQNYFKVFSGLSLNFNAGDQLRGRWVDLGTNPSDMCIIFFFEVIP